MKKTNAILIGMRGSGKSTVGKALAQKMGKNFFDTDAEIEKITKKSIGKIVESSGWEAFRDFESEACRQLGKEKNAVIATGGGVVLRKKNMESLKQNGICIFLLVPVKVIAKRIASDNGQEEKRPSLTGKDMGEELEQVWRERQKEYLYNAEKTVSGNQPVVRVVKEIEKFLDRL